MKNILKKIILAFIFFKLNTCEKLKINSPNITHKTIDCFNNKNILPFKCNNFPVIFFSKSNLQPNFNKLHYCYSILVIKIKEPNIIDYINNKRNKNNKLYIVELSQKLNPYSFNLAGSIEFFEKENTNNEEYISEIKFFHEDINKIDKIFFNEVYNFLINNFFQKLVNQNEKENKLTLDLLSFEEIEKLLNNNTKGKKPLLNESELCELFAKKEKKNKTKKTKQKINPIKLDNKAEEESKQEENNNNKIFATTQSITDIKFAQEEWHVCTNKNNFYTYHILNKATDRGIKLHVIENIVESYLTTENNSLTIEETEDSHIVKLINFLGICVVYNKNEKVAITAYDKNNSL